MESSYEGMKVGQHSVTFDGLERMSGIYICFCICLVEQWEGAKKSHIEWDQSYFSFLCQIANGWGFNTGFQFPDKGPAIRWQISCKRALQEECQNAAPSFVIQMRWCLASKTHFHICFVIRLPGSQFWPNPTVAQRRLQLKKTHAKMGWMSQCTLNNTAEQQQTRKRCIGGCIKAIVRRNVGILLLRTRQCVEILRLIWWKVSFQFYVSVLFYSCV